MTKTKPAARAALPAGCVLSLRTHPRNPNHHLWWNNGTWWLHATLHRPDHTKQRLRLPLGTKNIHQARAHRDAVLETWSQEPRARSWARGVKSPKKRQPSDPVSSLSRRSKAQADHSSLATRHLLLHAEAA